MHVVVFLIAGTALSWVQESQEDQARKIDQLVRDLGSESYETREKAMSELRKIGKPALPALRKAAESDDPEIKLRAKQLIEEFERADKKPPMRRVVSRISVQSSNGDTAYIITPSEGDPITFKRMKDGSVVLEYVEGGQKKSAKSESLEKFLEEHKDLARKYGVSRDGIRYAGARASFHGGRTEFRFGPRDDPEEFFRKFEEEMERFRRQFREFGFDDQEWPFGQRKNSKWIEREAVLGVSLSPVDEALRAHVEIPEGAGLVVRKVAAGRGWADRGVRKHDILLEIDGKKVSSIEDVGDPQKMTQLVVLRAGKRVEIKKENK